LQNIDLCSQHFRMKDKLVDLADQGHLSQRCSSISASSGKQCRNYVKKGCATCASHAPR
jgi:hypothetical protein